MRSVKKNVLVITRAVGATVAAAALDLGVAAAIPATSAADPGTKYHNAPANPDVYHHSAVLADGTSKYRNAPADPGMKHRA
jgi:hypothetical protein